MYSATRAFYPIVLIFVFSTTAATAPVAYAANSLERNEDPVVLIGAELDSFVGEDPGSVVAFRYESGWVPIPVQVDERDVVDFGTPYDTLLFGITVTMYTDEGTFTGPDSDPTFDADDEVVFMAKDAGDSRASVSTPDPTGVVVDSRQEVKITDPIFSRSAYVYLFVTDGSLPQDANTDYVAYDFDLLSGDYKTTYSILTGPNPENSEVVTDYYRVHFADRWIRDEVNVKAGSATQVDILDRHKNLFGPGICGRSEDTFSAGEGCFVANIDGPVRAIRSYLGANSGPFTQRIHRFYQRRHDIATHLRVHPISGVMDYYDYSPAATGMTYYNDLNTGGVTIDGDPTGDTVTPGTIAWEMVTGAQGTLVMWEKINTDMFGFNFTSYYSDDSLTSVTQCTGDAFEYGASGLWVNQPIPNTHPQGTYNNFVAYRTIYYEGPDQPVSRAQLLAAQAEYFVGIYLPTAAAGDTPQPAVALMQSAPNPFGASTTIRFHAPTGSRPTLRIYDVAGRLVKILRIDTFSGGAGTATWNGTDTAGNRMSSGVYFYRLTVKGTSITRKLVLLD